VPRLAALLSVLALVAAGCGGSDSGGSSGGSGGSGGGGSSSTPPKQVFANACGSCHTLGAAGTDGSFGPNLDELQPSQAEVASAIKNGPGPMPAGLVKGAEATALAKYVSESAGKQ
jgi:hypothetical protein